MNSTTSVDNEKLSFWGRYVTINDCYGLIKGMKWVILVENRHQIGGMQITHDFSKRTRGGLIMVIT